MRSKRFHFAELPEHAPSHQPFSVLLFHRTNVLMKWFAISLALGSLAYGATTIDEIVGVVGKHAIKITDIERDLRVTQFLNGESPSSSVAAKKRALERLIDQELIRNDMAASKNASHLDNEATTLFNQMLSDRFGSSKPQMAAELRRHGLTEAQLL